MGSSRRGVSQDARDPPTIASGLTASTLTWLNLPSRPHHRHWTVELMADVLTRHPLVPSEHDVRPYRDASPHLGDPAALRALADESGYLYFPALLPTARVAQARDEIRLHGEACGWFQSGRGGPHGVFARPGATLSGQGFDDPDWTALQRRLNGEANSAFRALGQTIADLGIVDVLYETEPAALAQANIGWVKLPGSPQHTTRPHQDLYYAPTCPDQWTAWAPLTDTDLNLGTLALAEGSHQCGALHHESALTGIEMAADTRWASADAHVGDVIFFGALTVHAAWSNVTPDRARLSADYRFLRAGSPRVF